MTTCSTSSAHLIAAAASIEVEVGASIDASASLPVYVETFTLLAEVAVVVGLLVLLTAPLVKRYMHNE